MSLKVEIQLNTNILLLSSMIVKKSMTYPKLINKSHQPRAPTSPALTTADIRTAGMAMQNFHVLYRTLHECVKEQMFHHINLYHERSYQFS